MPNQRSTDKTQINCWVQDAKELELYCKETGKTKTEVIQQFINELKEIRKRASK